MWSLVHALLGREGQLRRRCQSRRCSRRRNSSLQRNPCWQSQGLNRAAAGNNKREESQLEPRFPSRVLFVLCARLCLRKLPSRFSDQRVLNLEVEDTACQCTCFSMSNQIAAFARLRPPTQAARYARARSNISIVVPARAKVANVSNWMRFGPQTPQNTSLSWDLDSSYQNHALKC
jgi:hypothetical protein